MELEPGWIGAGCAVILAVLGGGMYVIRAEVLKGNEVTDQAHAEMIPNHGSSLRDAVDRMESRLHDVHTDVREIRKNQQDHLDWHLKREGN